MSRNLASAARLGHPPPMRIGSHTRRTEPADRRGVARARARRRRRAARRARGLQGQGRGLEGGHHQPLGRLAGGARPGARPGDRAQARRAAARRRGDGGAHLPQARSAIAEDRLSARGRRRWCAGRSPSRSTTARAATTGCCRPGTSAPRTRRRPTSSTPSCARSPSGRTSSKPMPYPYAFVRAIAPNYYRVPTKKEQLQYEMKLKEHLRSYKRLHKKWDEVTVGANDVPLDAKGNAVGEPPKEPPERSENELFGGQRRRRDPLVLPGRPARSRTSRRSRCPTTRSSPTASRGTRASRSSAASSARTAASP